MPLTADGTVREWAKGQVGGITTTDMTRLIAAADEVVSSMLNHEVAKATHTRTFDGNDALGPRAEQLWLDRRHRPVLYNPPGDDITVSENGRSLVVTSGYTTTADVVVAGANVHGPCILIRRPTGNADQVIQDVEGRVGWAGGIQNVTVTYNAGYETAGVPADITQLATEVVLLMIRDPKLVAAAAQSKKSASITIMRELSVASQSTVEKRMVR